MTEEDRIEIEGMVNRICQKQIANLQYGKFNGTEEIRPEIWDFKVDPAGTYPGNGWIFMSAFVVQPGYVGLLWRKKRTDISAEHGAPVMVPPPK